MALDNFANLKLEIIDWSHRDDMDLRIDTFIQLAETEMLNNPVEQLKMRSVELLASFSTNTSDRFVALPTGYQSIRKIRIQIDEGESHKLTFRIPEQLDIISSVRMPYFYTITDQIEFDCISDQIYTGEIQYYKDFIPLSTSNTTNDVLTNNPNIYLFGALAMLSNHVNNDADASKYYLQFINAIKGANNKAEEGRYAVAPQMIIDGSTP